jgi:non-ribosomal peptide synthetase-like protein
VQKSEHQADRAALLHAFFERSARTHPGRVALEIPPGADRPRRSLTYAELDAQAEAFARRLSPIVRSECVVAVLLPRHTLELFVAQLGILKAGAAYTCLDESFPDAHATFLLEDSRAVALVTDAAGAARARAARFPVAPILELDVQPGRAPENLPRPSPAWLGPSTLAYVIYTSGTTGKPKGVQIEHASVANLVASDVDYFGFGPAERMAQSSSPAYDSAVEETWLAFGCGATLVVLDEEIVRRGPDLVPWLREERISVFCPPPTQLRAMGCRDPERELPDLKLLYVGGEALPRDVADRWARGRWLENGYGPTECSITVVRTRIQPGAPITIGRPVRGNQAWVLDADLEEVADGSPGELCISGAGLARGYLNRPELTAEKFPVHPRLGRIYRTGDLAQRGPDGELTCLGRIDAQVKLRGHRIELGAIESVLAAQPGVLAAACTLQPSARGPLLVGFVVPDASAPALRIEELERALREAFPAYMVPSRFGILESLPRNVSGKLDRNALPVLAAPDRGAGPSGEGARDEFEQRLAAVFRSALELPEAPAPGEDFFLDLGGDSLAAAVAVSLLRDDPLTATLTVRDLYTARSVGALAARARAAASGGGAAPRAAPPGTRARPAPVSQAQLLFASAVQALFLAGELVCGAALVWALGFEALPAVVEALGLPLVLLAAPFAWLAGRLAWAPISIGLLVLAKKLLIGTYKPVCVPVLSGFYVRNWMVQQLAHLVPWNLIDGSEFENAALRALGARIGSRVHIHRGVVLCDGGWDLLTLGDDVMVGQDAALRLVDLVDGCLVVGPVSVGASSTVDVRAGLSAHSALGERAFLGALSNLPAGVRVPDGECWDGVPAQPAGAAPERKQPVPARELSPAAHAALLLLARSIAGIVFPLPLLASLAGLAWLSGTSPRLLGQALLEGSWSGFGLVPISLALLCTLPLGLVCEALFVRALGRVSFGSISRFDPAYVRVAIKTEVLQSAGDWLAGTLLWPAWLRLAGMRIGRNCELSTIIDVVPECLEIGDDCFLADGIYLGGPRLHRGVVTLSHTRLARGDFLGNHAVILDGQELPEEVLIGVCTVPEPGHMHGGSSWFGHPPFELPRTKHTGFARSLTHKPNLARRANRLAWELARFLLPVPPLWLLFAATSWAASRAELAGSALEAIGLVALASFASAAAAVLAVLALKWILLGRVRPGEHAFWSFWCCRWDYHYELWSTWARHLLVNLEGTLFLPWYLRAMGAKIGRRSVLAGGFSHVVDPDMLQIEDDVTVHALFQAHSFEDKVLKIDKITIRSGADVGSGAVLFYGAEIGEGAVVAPHSVVMKHERLLPGRVYEGCPTVLSQGIRHVVLERARELVPSAVNA